MRTLVELIVWMIIVIGLITFLFIAPDTLFKLTIVGLSIPVLFTLLMLVINHDL